MYRQLRCPRSLRASELQHAREVDVICGLGAERWFDSSDSFDYAANSVLRLRNGDSNAILFPCCELQYIKDCEALNTM